MRVLAVADIFIGPIALEQGLAFTPELCEDLTIREWHHNSMVDLQEDNLAVEQRGPGAIPEPPGIFDGIEEFDVLITQFCPVNADVVARATRLKAIGVLRGGTENVDPSAEARGIPVVASPGRNANAVAEFSVGLILAETRNIARSHHQLCQGIWGREFPNIDVIPELSGRPVGLVGMGQIGQTVARLLTAFGAEVCYFDPYVDDPTYVRETDLAEMAAKVDVLSIHSRLSESNYRIVSADVIARMRPTAVLVNTARSGLVDEPALIEALRERRIMGAAIDTFDIEPLPPDSPFFALDNVTLAAHLAGTTTDALERTPRILGPRLAQVLRDLASHKDTNG